MTVILDESGSSPELAKQIEDFLDQYMIDYNGSRAARAVGISEESCARQAYRWLQRPDVYDEVNRRRAEKRARARITVLEVECLIRDIAEVDILHIFDEDGNIRPLQDMPPHARKAIKVIKKTEHSFGDIQTVTTTVELWNKNDMIKLLGQYKKMFSDKLEIDATIRQRVAFSINGIAK